MVGISCFAAKSASWLRSANKIALDPMTRAAARSRTIDAKAPSNSSAPRTGRDCRDIPSAWAALCAFRAAVPEPLFPASQIMARRDACGTTWRRSSSRLAIKSESIVASPVTFPPGRLRLAARPRLTGSSTAAMTIGIVSVARLAAWVASTPLSRWHRLSNQPTLPREPAGGRPFPMPNAAQKRQCRLRRSPARASAAWMRPTAAGGQPQVS